MLGIPPPYPDRLYGLMRGILKGDFAMDKAFRNALFLTGLPMAVCGLAIGIPALWIAGLGLVVCGWVKSNRRM
ncbi:hypothetical protein FD951_15530 [Pseudomonas chlororaphis subsp. aurantiaca]|nr:hypothetical protein FD951_15530 [Pseudomonas chlororaphis subsp. aurantiaca]